MKSSRSFHNLFIPNHPSNNSKVSPPYHPIMAESQYFDGVENYKSQNHTYSNLSIYIDKNASTQHSTSRNSGIFQTCIHEKRSSVLERSKSQILQPIYISPFTKDIGQDINQSNHLALSKASQVTFAKPSQFLGNYQKQSFFFDTSHKNIISSPQTIKNDYGYQSNTNYSNNAIRNESTLRVLSPMKSSYMTDNYNSCKSSIIVNQNQATVFPKFVENSIIQSKTTPIRPLKTTVIFKNQPTDYGLKPELRRALSTISIMSGKSRNQSSGTKINFNYTSPSKIENKMTRKLSFRKEDVNNPLNKLTRKKQLSKNKIEKSLSNKSNKPQSKIKKLQSKINKPESQIINNEVVNEYFPQFKLKRNKIKNLTSPPKRLSIHKNNQPIETIQKNQSKIVNQIKKFHKVNSVKDSRKSNQSIEVSKENPLNPTNQGDRNQYFQDDERRNHTFIAGLDGFSQLSELKIRQKQQSTDIDTPKKIPLFEFKHCDTQSKKRIDIDFSKSNKIQGYRITLIGQIVPLGGQLYASNRSQNEPFQPPQQTQQQISKIQKDSQISIDSLKHGQQLEFLNKYANDSENTTDYEQEIVRKLKQQLGLNYSYYKK